MCSQSTPVRRGRAPRALGFLGGVLLSAPFAVFANEHSDAAQLADLSLEELLNMEITSLTRKAEDLASAPAAVFVISQADIQRSGARTIPDLLRMVPGMQVAQLDSNKYAVTARGANGRFANKLLVLMDGRNLYSPLLSGVYWDAQDTDLSLIERIEVIRGPGATMWGANAVNGVVNIITKNAADTQGGSLSLMTSNRETVESHFRYGGNNGSLDYRVFAKYLDKDGNVDLNDQDTGDTWEMFRAGTRADWFTASGSKMSLSAEAYSGEAGETTYKRMPIPPYQVVTNATDEISGAFALFDWNKSSDDDSRLQFKTYVSFEERDSASLGEERKTFDVDFQHEFPIGSSHLMMWGAGYRYSDDDLVNSFDISILPASDGQSLLSAFIQDDIAVTDNLRVIVGSKFEHSNMSNRSIEVEPSIRFSLKMDDRHSFWGAVSRAVRMPSRGERDGRVVSAVIPAGAPPFSMPVPLVPTLRGDHGFGVEEVIAYEVGVKFQSEKLFTDLALFFNDYDDLRSVAHGELLCRPSGEVMSTNPACIAGATYLEIPFILENGTHNDTMGAELWISADMTGWWHLSGAYTWYHVHEPDGANPLQLQFAEDSPDHQASLRSSMEIRSDLQLDFWARYVDELSSQDIDSYTALDVRLAWSPSPNVEIAAVGRNLIAGTHLEFVSELGDLTAVQIEAEGYVEVRWGF